MSGDLKFKCPIDRVTRAWIDRRWTWLKGQFGATRPQSTRVILPQDEYFPDRFDNTPEDAETLLKRVCSYMSLDPAFVKLNFYEDHNPNHSDGFQAGTAGLYLSEGESTQIWIEVANLHDPIGLISTLAHELGHIHLLGHGRVSPDEPDHERLTDLLTVFLGFGVITANSVIREDYWDEGAYSSWRIRRRGYLSMREYGYALALFARDRNEIEPEWASFLRPDVRDAFNKSDKYLLVRPDNHEAADSHEIESPEAPDAPPLDDEEPTPEPTLTQSEFDERLAAGDRDFSGCRLQDLNLQALDLRGCSFADADFNGADLTDANLQDCDLHDAGFQEAILLRANLRRSNLKGVDFGSASLIQADLEGADIRGADFSSSSLEGAILTGAKRDRSTDLSNADISEVVCDSDLMNENLAGETNFEAMHAGYARFSDVVRVVFVLFLSGLIGALCGFVAGQAIAWATNLPILIELLSACGLVGGAILGLRSIAGPRN